MGGKRADRPGEDTVGRAQAGQQLSVHLVYRFLLELALLAALGYWGWALGDGGAASWMLAALLPLLAATVWGTFATPADPSRGGDPPVPVPGAIRLTIEAALFALAAYGLWTAGSRAAAETLLTVVGLHYALTWDRIAWLLRH